MPVHIETKLGSATIDVDEISAIFDERGDFMVVSLKNGLQQEVLRTMGEKLQSLWIGEITQAEFIEWRASSL